MATRTAWSRCLLAWIATLAAASLSCAKPVIQSVPLVTHAHQDDVTTFLRVYSRDAFDAAFRLGYRVGFVDLDNDGVDEALVLLEGQYYCGTGGCNLLVLSRDAGTFRVVTNLRTTWPPVRVLQTMSNGWRDFSVTAGGGGMPAGTDVLSFDGREYVFNAPYSARLASNGEAGRLVIERDSRYIELVP